MDRELETRPARETGDWLGALEDAAMLRVALDRHGGGRPAALVRDAVDGVGDAEAGGLGAGQSAGKLHLVGHGRVRNRVGFASDFAEKPAPASDQAGTAVG